jgi:transcriptional regulator with XRE-family HTH domain
MQDDPLADAMADFGEELRTLLGERSMSLRELARRAHCDPGYLSRVANGHKPVTPRLAAALDDALAAEGRLNSAAGAMAFRSRRGSEKRMGSARGAVTSADVDAVAAITLTFRSLDNQFGGGHTHVLAAEYLDSNVIPMLRTGIYTETVGQRLFGEAAQLAHLAAWTAYDMGGHGRARQYFGTALELATAAGDHAFGAEILAARGHHAIHLGHPARAAELARACQHIAKKAALPALLAEGYALEGNSYALVGDARACSASLRDAEQAFWQADPVAVPGWLGYFDEGYLAARFAHSLRDLGDWGEARRYAEQAIGMSGGLVRARAFNMAVLASTYIVSDLDEACGVALDVLGLATGLQSGRVVYYISDFKRRLNSRHGNEPAARNFSRRAMEVLGAK